MQQQKELKIEEKPRRGLRHGKKKCGIVLTNRDLAILCFLRKWRVASTKALAARFFPNTRAFNAYVRLRELAKTGYIQSRYDRSSHKHLWVLTKHGLNAIEGELPCGNPRGFGSEDPGRDLLVSALHIGDFLRDEPEGVDLFSKEELKRYDLSQLPYELRQKNCDWPDGYWFFTEGGKRRIFALQVEVKARRSDEYISMFRSMAFAENFLEEVIWLVKDKYLLKRIQCLFKEARMGKEIHSYFIIQDLIFKGWGAQALLGRNAGKTVREILNSQAHFQLVNSVVQNGVRSQYEGSTRDYHLQFFDLSKSHKGPDTYKIYQLGDFSK